MNDVWRHKEALESVWFNNTWEQPVEVEQVERAKVCQSHVSRTVGFMNLKGIPHQPKPTMGCTPKILANTQTTQTLQIQRPWYLILQTSSWI